MLTLISNALFAHRLFATQITIDEMQTRRITANITKKMNRKNERTNEQTNGINKIKINQRMEIFEMDSAL